MKSDRKYPRKDIPYFLDTITTDETVHHIYECGKLSENKCKGINDWMREIFIGIVLDMSRNSICTNQNLFKKMKDIK